MEGVNFFELLALERIFEDFFCKKLTLINECKEDARPFLHLRKPQR